MKRMMKVMAVAVAMTLPGAAMSAGLLNSNHDFANKNLATQTDGAGNPLLTAGSVGLCSYCHTPHSAQSTALLWNHKVSSNSFTWDEATTAGGTSYPTLNGATYKGPTVKCLGCHDGSVAVGDISLYKEKTNAVYNTYQIPTTKVGTSGTSIGLTSTNVKQLGLGGALGGNHPVGVPYPLNQAASTYNGITTGSRVELDQFVANPVNQNGQFIKLYNDNGGGAITAGANGATTGIECTTCHDPHNKQVPASGGYPFGRAMISGSQASDGYVCVQCHIK